MSMDTRSDGIMETHPTPIVIVSGSTDPREVARTFRAMEAGAVVALRRPAGIGHPNHEATASELLAQTSSLPVHLAAHDEPMRPGHVYVAPDGFQMRVERSGNIVLTKDEPENGMRPSVSYLLRSVAEVYGRDAVAGLLTGMGRDGAEELKLLKEKGAVTFAQDKDRSVVHGMPGAAIKLDAATLVLPPERIAATLTSLAKDRK
jgi:chemotaxis response regulator CheB